MIAHNNKNVLQYLGGICQVTRKVPTQYWKYWKSIEFENQFSRPWKSIEIRQNMH